MLYSSAAAGRGRPLGRPRHEAFEAFAPNDFPVPFLLFRTKGSTDKFHCSRAFGGQHLKPIKAHPHVGRPRALTDSNRPYAYYVQRIPNCKSDDRQIKLRDRNHFWSVKILGDDSRKNLTSVLVFL